MLVDLSGYFNYDQYTMAEAAPAAPAPETAPKTEANPERKIRATRRAVEQVSSTLFNKSVVGKTPEEVSSDPVAREVRSAKRFADITKDGIGDRIVLPGHPEHGNELEEGSKKLEGGEVSFLVDGKKALMAEIQDVRGEDEIQVAYFEASDTNKDAMKIASISRGELHDALLVSERSAIEKELEDPDKYSASEKAVMKSYLDMIDPNLPPDAKPTFDEDLRKHAEKAAHENDILTSQDVSGLIKKFFPDEAKRPADVQVFLETLGEETVLSKENFQRSLDVMGLKPESFREKARGVREEINLLKAKLDADPEDTIAKRDLEDAQAAFTLLDTVDSLWSEAAKKGETPFDAYFSQVQNGEIKSEDAKAFTEAFRSGKIDSLIEQLPALQETDDMSDEQKAELNSLKAKLKDPDKWIAGGKIVGGGLLAVVLIALFAAAGTVAVGGGAVSALSKGARQ